MYLKFSQIDWENKYSKFYGTLGKYFPLFFHCLFFHNFFSFTISRSKTEKWKCEKKEKGKKRKREDI